VWLNKNFYNVVFDNGIDGRESFAHTKFIDFMMHIPKDQNGNGGYGFYIENNDNNPNAKTFIYNSLFQGMMFTNSDIYDRHFIYNEGNFKDNHFMLFAEGAGVIENTFGASFINSGFFKEFTNSIQLIDDNTDESKKIRIGFDLSHLNASGFTNPNWEGTGTSVEFKNGLYSPNSITAGYHFITGNNIVSPVVQFFNYTGNGFFVQRINTVDFEKGAVTVFKVDKDGKVYPNNGTANLQQGTGEPSSLPAGSLFMRSDSNRQVDLTPLWTSTGGAAPMVMPVQLVYATTNRPSNPKTGMMIFDTNLKKPIWWNGTIWVDATGTAV